MNGALSYFARLRETLPGVLANLEAKGIQPRHLAFGGEGAVLTRAPVVPTDARSEFLANRAMGDWAERTLGATLALAFPEWRVISYGDAGQIAAGRPGFRASYLAGLEDTRRFGKRPDLLLFPANTEVAADLSGLSQTESAPAVSRALAAVEVRSSKFEALTYMAVRRRQRAEGNRSGRETPSFTVKVEDLVIVYRWLERYGVPQSYVQVFFDSIFAINFLDIFAELANTDAGWVVETPEKAQQKATLMIPITRGTQVGTATALPAFTAEQRITTLGRHDAYVVPTGGSFNLDAEAMRRILCPT